MTTQTLEAKPSHYRAVTAQKRKVGHIDVDQASAVILPGGIPPGRRCEARMDYRSLCSYELLETIDEQSPVIEQGKAFAFNRSTEGMLLFMALAPHAKQLMEVHTARFRWGWAANLFEVRWTKPVPVESFGNLYMVGCRRIFGPCHYLSF